MREPSGTGCVSEATSLESSEAAHHLHCSQPASILKWPHRTIPSLPITALFPLPPSASSERERPPKPCANPRPRIHPSLPHPRIPRQNPTLLKASPASYIKCVGGEQGGTHVLDELPAEVLVACDEDSLDLGVEEEDERDEEDDHADRDPRGNAGSKLGVVMLRDKTVRDERRVAREAPVRPEACPGGGPFPEAGWWSRGITACWPTRERPCSRCTSVARAG